MTNRERLARLFDTLEIGESYYFEGAYYRLKDHGEAVYSLQRAVPGMCGEKTASPSLKFGWHEEQLSYLFYVDFEAQPLVMKPYSEEEQVFFEQALDRLLNQFEALLDGHHSFVSKV